MADAEVVLSSDPFEKLDLRASYPIPARSSRSRRIERTDENGVARLHPPAGTSLNLAVYADGYGPSETVVAVGSNWAKTVDLDQGATLRVRVVDEAGEPLVGVILELQRVGRSFPTHDTSSLAEGIATFTDLGPGEYRIRSRVDPWAFRPPSYEAGQAWQPVVVAAGGVTETHLVSRGFYDFSGRVTQGGRPVVGASISLDPQIADPSRSARFRSPRNSRFQVRTRADGSFQFHVINEGLYNLVIEHPSRVMRSFASIEVKEGMQPIEVNLSSCSLQGRVLDQFGDPVKGTISLTAEPLSDEAGNRLTFGAQHVHVAFENRDGQARASQRVQRARSTSTQGGAYRFDGVAHDRPLKAVFSCPFFAHEVRELAPLGFDEERTLDWTLTLGGQLQITVQGDEDDWDHWEETQQFSVKGVRVVDGAEVPDSEFSFVLEGERTDYNGCAPGHWWITLHRREGDELVELQRRTVVVRARAARKIQFQTP